MIASLKQHPEAMFMDIEQLVKWLYGKHFLLHGKNGPMLVGWKQVTG
jgi:hypothetical protein